MRLHSNRAGWALAVLLAVAACSSGDGSSGDGSESTTTAPPEPSVSATDPGPESTAADTVVETNPATTSVTSEPVADEPGACPVRGGAQSVPEGSQRRAGENRQLCFEGRWVADPVLDTSTTVPSDEELAAATIGPGTYSVPAELLFGFYRVTGAWTVRDSGGAVLDRDEVDPDRTGFALLSVGSEAATADIGGEAFGLEFVPVFDPVAEDAVQGTYLVGTDVAPGDYRVTDPQGAVAIRLALSESGQWEVLEEQTGTEVTVTVEPADFALRFSGSLEPA